MNEFVDNIKILINALGYKVLEPFAQYDVQGSTKDDELLYISEKSACPRQKSINFIKVL